MTVPVPAAILLLVALASARRSRSFGTGLRIGALALVASFVALCAVLALEGLVWMDRRGVFILDGDPPKGFVSTKDVVLDIFSTGMWFGHALLWVLGVLIGAMLGALVAATRSVANQGAPHTASHDQAAAISDGASRSRTPNVENEEHLIVNTPLLGHRRPAVNVAQAIDCEADA